MNKIIGIVCLIWLYFLLPGSVSGNENKRTAKDIYHMIADNGFYCELTYGSPFHQEAFKGLQKPPKQVFPLKRKNTVVQEPNGLILTHSVNTQSVKKNENKTIELRWSTNITNCTFKQAMETIDTLNKTQKDKKQTWRIPTAMELFSIVSDKTKNHLPTEFKLPANQTLLFWTSTPVKKQGTVLEYDQKNTAYFVVRSFYDRNRDIYALSFGFQNIEPNHKTNAFLLPVLSGKVYTYQPPKPPPASPAKSVKPTTTTPKKPKKSQGNKNSKSPIKSSQTSPLPGYQDKDKIPGFDDFQVPAKKQSKKNSPPQKKSGSLTPGKKIPGFDYTPGSTPGNTKTRPTASYTFKISLYPVLRVGIVPDRIKNFLENLNKQVKRDISVLGAKVKRELKYSLSLEERKLNIFDQKSIKEIGQLNKIIVHPYLSQAARLRKIKDELMSAPHVDIVIVLQYFYSGDNSIYFLVPTIISGISHEIYSIPFVLKKSQAGILSKYIKEVTGKIIYNFFSMRRFR